MRQRWLHFSYSILILAIGFVNSAFAQTPETRTGCLMKGTNAKYYLVDEVTGRRLEITGADLDKLTEGKTQSQITATGAIAIENGREVYKATDVKQTRVSCAPIAYNPDAQRSEIGKIRVGVRAGFAIDPELV